MKPKIGTPQWIAPELSPNQWAMLLRLLMEVVPKHIVTGSLDYDFGRYQAIEAYKRNIEELMNGN